MRGAHFKFRLQSYREPTTRPTCYVFFLSSPLVLVVVGVVVAVVVLVDGVRLCSVVRSAIASAGKLKL